MKRATALDYTDRIDKVRNNPGIQPVVKKTMVSHIVNEMVRRSWKTFAVNGYRAVQFQDLSGAIIGPDPHNPGETAVAAGDKERMEQIVAMLNNGGK